MSCLTTSCYDIIGLYRLLEGCNSNAIILNYMGKRQADCSTECGLYSL